MKFYKLKYPSKIVFTCIITFISITLTGQSIAQNKATQNWKMLVSDSSDNVFSTVLTQSFSRYVQEFSNGKLTIEIIPQKATTGKNLLEKVGNSEFQMSHFSPAELFSYDPSLTLFSSVPFGMIATERNAWIYEGGGLALMQESYKKHNVYTFPGGNSGIQMGGWFNKPIKSKKDLKGISMASSGLTASIFSALDVNTVDIPLSEQASALQQKRVAAVSGGSPALTGDAQFAKVAENFYIGWDAPGKDRQFFINIKSFDSLSKELQLALTSAMRLAAYDIYTYMTHLNAQKLKSLQQQFPDTKIYAFPRDVLRALRRESAKAMLSIQQSTPQANKVMQSIKTYQKQVRLWTRIGDQAYLNNSR